MTRVPLTADPDATAEDVARLIEAANIHHLPLVDGQEVVGLWLATDEGPTVLISAENVGRVDASDPAERALNQLLDDREMVIAWEGSEPVGVLTRTDLKRVLSTAMEQDAHPRTSGSPLIVRFFGVAGSGKTTLILRTIPRLREWESGVVEACQPSDRDRDRRQLEGQPLVSDERAHQHSLLPQVIGGLGPVDVVLLEDRDRPTVPDDGLGESLRVMVIAAHDIGSASADDFADLEAVVITKLDVAPDEFDLSAARRMITAAAPDAGVFGVAAAIDERGLQEWQTWLEEQCLPRLHSG
jgi:CBS domain-containing protein